MAVRIPSKLTTAADGADIIQWTGLLQGDTGDKWPLGGHADNNVEVAGTLGPATVQILGSLDPAVNPTNLLTDQNGTDLALKAADVSGLHALKQILQHPYWIGVAISGGDGTTNVTVTVKIKRGA